jgi:hypothetical protein
MAPARVRLPDAVVSKPSSESLDHHPGGKGAVPPSSPTTQRPSHCAQGDPILPRKVHTGGGQAMVHRTRCRDSNPTSNLRTLICPHPPIRLRSHHPMTQSDALRNRSPCNSEFSFGSPVVTRNACNLVNSRSCFLGRFRCGLLYRWSRPVTKVAQNCTVTPARGPVIESVKSSGKLPESAGGSVIGPCSSGLDRAMNRLGTSFLRCRERGAPARSPSALKYFDDRAGSTW